MSLNFSQHNSFASALREMLLQIDELSKLLHMPEESYLPITDLISDSEKNKILPVLNDMRSGVLNIARELDIKIEPIFLRHKLNGSIAYMRTIILGLRPNHLHAYGSLSKEDAEMITSSVTKIISLIDKISSV